jgi:succinylglutamate desuccinylase
MLQSSVDIEAITAERGEQYGDFADQAHIAQDLKDYMRLMPGWNDLLPHQRESLDMIQHKISRILNGNPNIVDSWSDIAGYAHIVAVRIPKA